MPSLNQSELNSIREMVGGHQIAACKLDDYANMCTDANIKQMFSQGAKDAKKNAQDLINMISLT